MPHPIITNRVLRRTVPTLIKLDDFTLDYQSRIAATGSSISKVALHAYCRLGIIEWRDPAKEMILGMKVFANREARIMEKEPLDIQYYYLLIEEALAFSAEGNIIAFGYGFVKLKNEAMAKGTDI